MKQKRRSTFGRKIMKLVCSMLGFVLAVMLGATLVFQFLLGRIQYVDTGGALSAGEEALGDALLGGDVSGEDGDQIGGRGSGLVNILLIGQDRREGEGRTRSDTMILCTFDPDRKRLTMTSFLRDLYVQIPGYGSNRLNAAYAYGGMALLEQTMAQNFGVVVDGCVEVDFAQFSGIVDLLGGVEITLRQDEAELINEETGSALSEGTYLLNGDQALAYSRIRKLDADGDFSRTARQRRVISAMLEAYRGAGLGTMLSLANPVLPMITTNLSSARILTCALELFPMLSGMEVVSQYVPAEGMYTNQNIDGMAVLVADTEAVRQTLCQSLGGE